MNWEQKMRRYLLFLTIAISCAIGATALSLLLFSGSYDECVVGEMKGQPTSMQHIVEKLCARRHQKEVRISAYDKEINWSQELFGEVLISVNQLNSEYIFTRGEFAFSEKNCEESSKDDFTTIDLSKQLMGTNANSRSDIANFDIKRGLFSINASKDVRCMRTIRLWGLYR